MNVNKLSEQTIKVLRMVKKAILAEPKKLAMEKWGEYNSARVPEKKRERVLAGKEEVPLCGTTACIAGHVVMLT